MNKKNIFIALFFVVFSSYSSAMDNPFFPSQLSVAVKDNNFDQVDALLKSGANPNQASYPDKRDLPLRLAVKNLNLPIVKRLLEAGATFDYAFWRFANSVGVSRFENYSEAEKKRHDILNLLFQYGQDVIKPGEAKPKRKATEGKAPAAKRPKESPQEDLFNAVKNVDPEKVYVALQAGANPGIPTRYNKTPLMEAAEITSPKGAVIMQYFMIFPDLNPNVLGEGGNTALHYAARAQSANAVAQLINLPATNVNIRNDSGATPLDIAISNNNANIKDLLRNRNGFTGAEIAQGKAEPRAPETFSAEAFSQLEVKPGATPQEILGIKLDATKAEAEAAFKVLVRRWHPDLNRNNPKAQEVFQIVNWAIEQMRKK